MDRTFSLLFFSKWTLSFLIIYRICLPSHSPNPASVHKGSMRFFENGCNGGMENFLLEIGGSQEWGAAFLIGGWEIS